MTTPSLPAVDQSAATGRSQRGTPVPQLPLEQIGPMPGQPRQSFEPTALQELAESIKAHGVIQPIIVIERQDATESESPRYRIVCGERRYQAAKLAGMTAIPALVRDYADDEVAVLALLENLQREDLTPLEEGEYLFQLKQKYGFTEEQLGDRLGKSRDYVHGRTRLLSLSPDILAAWKQAAAPGIFATLTPSHAIWINQLDSADLRQALTSAVLEEELTVAEVRRRLEMLKQLAAEAEWLPAEALDKLQRAAVKGMSQAEFAMRLSGYKKRLEPTPVSEGPGPRLAVQDLAIYSLIERLVHAGDREVAFREVEAALKKDAAWIRKLTRDGLANI